PAVRATEGDHRVRGVHSDALSVAIHGHVPFLSWKCSGVLAGSQVLEATVGEFVVVGTAATDVDPIEQVGRDVGVETQPRGTTVVADIDAAIRSRPIHSGRSRPRGR